MERKVLFVHDSFFYKDEDSQFHSIHINDTIIKRYLKLGDSITFIGRCKDILKKDVDNKFSSLGHEKCEVKVVPNSKSISGYLKHNRLISSFLKKNVKEHDIIIPRLPSTLGTIVLNFGLKYNKAILGEIVSCNWDALWNYGLKGKIIAPYFYFKQKRVVKKVPYCIYVTNEFLQKRYPTKGNQIGCSDVVLHGSDIKVLDRKIEKLNELKKRKKIILGTIAALDVPYKGQKYVIEAMHYAKDRKLIYQVVGHGTGEKLDIIAKKKGVEECFQIIGPVKHSEIANFLDSIDIYIQPSEQEGLPRAVLEAMNRALPVIGSRTGGIPELLDKDFIFTKGDVHDLSNILKNLEVDKLKEQALKNYNKSLEYTAEVLNDKRNSFYQIFLKQNFT